MKALQGLQVLVVEDDMLVSMLIEDMLADLGCIVIGPAARVKKAVELAACATIDVALLDINVAGVAVYPVAAELERRGIPFAFVTGYQAALAAERFSDHPALQKPVQARALEEIIRRALTRMKE